MAKINKPLSQMTFSQAENLARQRNLTPNKYGATLAGTWTNQGLADALGVSIVKPSRSVYSSGQKVLATPTALKPPPTRADVLSQAQSLGDTTYGITQSPYNAATDVARTRYLNQVLPGKMTPLKAMAQGVGVTPEELNAAYLAGQQKGQQRDTTWTQTKAELDSRGAPDWFKVASALAGAHVGAQNLGSNIISDPAVHLSDAAKVGLSAYSGYKSPENISTKQILNIALPTPTLAEGGLVGYAGGGQYSATGIRPTPEQRPVVGALARMVQGVDKFARAPFGYTNPPVEAISDFLRVPELYRTMENYAYGSPLASGTSPVSRYLPRLSEDTKGAIEASTNLIPLVGPTMRATKATARAAAPYAARQALGLTEKYGVAPTMNVVKPTGNLNLQPILRQEILKGSDVQPVENFLAQAKATPGVTKDAFIELADRYSDLVPGTKLSKAEFESKIPPSQYSKVDLQNAAGGIEDDLMEQAYDIVNEDASGVFEMVLDRLGVPARQIPQGQYGNYINALQNYHLGDIGFDDLPAPLKRSMARQGIHDDQYAFGDLVQEQLDEAVYQTAQDLRGYMDDDLVDAYRFVDVQRLLPASVRERLNEKNYFEVGVTHPHRADISYEHYPRYETGQDGLIGHFRGTMIPADVTDATAIVPGSTIKNPSVINLKPNSVIIEEIQSDAQKGAFSAEQTGALRQVHGTLFKAAVTEALERGARTVYFPTAQTIATVRSGDAKKYTSIYDQQIVREGLKPLSKIPGVEIKPIEVNLTSVKGKTPPGSSVAYHEINFTDEAAEDILKGSGQQAPGYAAGGLVGYAEGGKFDLKEISDLAQKTLEKFTSLDTPQDMTTAETVADIAAGFVPGVGTAQSARDFERARREDDKLGMGLSALGMVPIVGGAVKPVRKVVDPWAEMYRKYFDKAPTNPSRSAEMRSIQEALSRTEKRAPTENKRKIYDQVDWPQRFYRGIKNATLGPNGEPLSDVSSLVMPQRGSEVLAIQPNNPRNTAWAASNPLTAGNFAGYDPNSLIVPLRLVEKPDVVFNANASPWDRFFSQTGQLNRFSSNYPLREDFKSLMRDPAIRSILIKDIFDYNSFSPEALDRFSKLYGVSLKPEHLLSDTLLIKDPSVVQYLFTKETPKITEPTKKSKSKPVSKKGDNYAAGGLVNYDPAEIDTIASRIREELYG